MAGSKSFRQAQACLAGIELIIEFGDRLEGHF